MADLSTMFNQLGPAGGSILAGVQMGNEANAAKSEQALRQAQMDKLIEETNQARLMNPLELQAKQQTISSNALKAKVEEGDYHQKALGEMIPRLESVPEAARHAAVVDMAKQAGIPLDQNDLTHLQTMDAKQIVPYLKRAHEHFITQNEKYRQAMDVALTNERSHKYSADRQLEGTKYSADQRANAAAAKKQGIASIQENVRSGKMTAEKAAVALYGAAQFETDPATKAQYEDMAKQYELFAMNQRNAANQGRVDVGAAANLPTQTLPPALGGPGAGPAPTANPNRRPISQY